jgi:hypothetical protein
MGNHCDLLNDIATMSGFVNRHLRHVKPAELVCPLLHYNFHYSLLFLSSSCRFFIFINLRNCTCTDSVNHIGHKFTPLHRLIPVDIDLREQLQSAMKQFIFFIIL